MSLQDAVIPGTDARSSAEAPGAVTPGVGEARLAWGGRVTQGGSLQTHQGGAVRSAPHPSDVLPIPLHRDPLIVPRGSSQAEGSPSPPWLQAGASSWLREVL